MAYLICHREFIHNVVVALQHRDYAVDSWQLTHPAIPVIDYTVILGYTENPEEEKWHAEGSRTLNISLTLYLTVPSAGQALRTSLAPKPQELCQIHVAAKELTIGLLGSHSRHTNPSKITHQNSQLFRTSENAKMSVPFGQWLKVIDISFPQSNDSYALGLAFILIFMFVFLLEP